MKWKPIISPGDSRIIKILFIRNDVSVDSSASVLERPGRDEILVERWINKLMTSRRDVIIKFSFGVCANDIFQVGLFYKFPEPIFC